MVFVALVVWILSGVVFDYFHECAMDNYVKCRDGQLYYKKDNAWQPVIDIADMSLIKCEEEK